MPSRASQKGKKGDGPAQKPSKAQPKRSTPAAAGAPPKKKAQTITKSLARDPTAQIPVDVTHDGESTQSKIRKTNDYGHNLKLVAPTPFELVKSIIIPDGEYKGMQAILIRPSKPFRFLSLPKEARARVYMYYFAPRGVVNSEIVLETKRKDTRDVYSKTYADSSKDRVALLAVNKEVYDEAAPALYANTLKFENTTTLLDFLGQLQNPVRARLTSLWVKQYVRTSSRNAMQFLGEAAHIQHLHIEGGVATEGDPAKAAKSFFADAYKFLEAVAAVKGNKAAAVDVLSFGKQALTYKDDQKKARPWSEQMVQEFMNTLKEMVEKK